MQIRDLMVDQIRQEVRAMGLHELRGADEVDDALQGAGTTLVAVNSVCGCAGGIMRPALRAALAGGPAPDAATTVFAGQDVEATGRAREYFLPHPPSSPSVALVRGGQTLWMLPRSRIEGRSHRAVADDIQAALQEHCARG
ncbi:MAG TPA: BrxA/BrxB family bacilliredoxin [Longimicrobiales bacterium]|nr:BrxA/BrxB family bacilliredoxin [Longimicrobiales bacterium]